MEIKVLRINADLHHRLKVYSTIKKIQISESAETAIERFLKDEDTKKTEENQLDLIKK